ncbi:carbohydrate kinase family protein [Candidatus Woesearchaeota archaeon]|nr:carbohydrate kinase family protein [Candidatus Woesearchaeota archaeon]
MHPPYDVLCIGSATVDRFLTINSPFEMIHPGDKVLVQAAETHSGGGATNSAAALSLLGLKVKMLTKIGDDHDAEFILREMKRYKVPNLCTRRSRRPTDSATVISAPKNADRIIFVHKGASQDLQVADFTITSPLPRWIYLATLWGDAFQTEKKIASFAQAKKIPLVFNPSLYLAAKGKSFLKSILDATTLLVLNIEEAQALLKTTEDKTKNLLKRLHAEGPKMIIITNGAKRCWALYDNRTYSFIPPTVKVVHTAGAGDAFTSGVVAGMIKRWKFEDCLRLGQINASSVIQHIGAKNKLLTEREARHELQKKKINIVIGRI